MSQETFGEFVLDAGARLLRREQRVVHLEPKVMDLLLYLVQNAERCVPKAELRRALWSDVTVGEAALVRLVKELRRGLGDDGEQPVFLRTVHGRGYQFIRRGAQLALECPSTLDTLCVGPQLASVIAPLRRVASSGLPVILEGETGTGKECIARAIHVWSGRSGPLLALRCVGLSSEQELESALTRAEEPATTLLLDEAGELPPALQRRLLAKLSSRDASHPGSLLRRTVVTSQRSLLGLVEKGELRADLLARLNGLSVELPPLRRRRADVPALTRFFLRGSSLAAAEQLPHALSEGLLDYDWPFNVRELEMLVRRWLALSGSELDRSGMHATALPRRDAG